MRNWKWKCARYVTRLRNIYQHFDTPDIEEGNKDLKYAGRKMKLIIYLGKKKEKTFIA